MPCFFTDIIVLGLDAILLLEVLWKATGREAHSSATCSKQRAGVVSWMEMLRVNLLCFINLCRWRCIISDFLNLGLCFWTYLCTLSPCQEGGRSPSTAVLTVVRQDQVSIPWVPLVAGLPLGSILPGRKAKAMARSSYWSWLRMIQCSTGIWATAFNENTFKFLWYFFVVQY